MIQTHHRWKHTTIPLSLDSSVDRFSKSSQFHGESLDSSLLISSNRCRRDCGETIKTL
ncbi:unnamed protein product [Brassica oleracea var. botrytis]